METVAGQIEEELREIESMDEDANITKIEALKNIEKQISNVKYFAK